MPNLIGIKKYKQNIEASDLKKIKNSFIHYKNSNYKITIHESKTCVLGNAIHPKAKGNKTSTPFVLGRYTLLLDGEIYNYQDIKNSLIKNGIILKSSKLEEIILHQLAEKGVFGISELNGDFAIAFYDEQNDELILARDRMGVKPLLYSIQEEDVFFSSELTPFKQLLKNWSIDKKALNAYFQFTYIPAPHTIINEVQKLLPGHFLKIKKGAIELASYLPTKNNVILEKDIKKSTKELQLLMESSILNRLKNTEQTATFLSGGVDSSIVSMITKKFKKDLNTFSIGYLNNEFIDETRYAQKVAQSIKSNHNTNQLNEENFKTEWKSILSSFDEPFADSSIVALYFLTKEAQERYSVFLSGDGADELFAGYHKHKAYVKGNSLNPFSRYVFKLLRFLPEGNRNRKFSNKIRQLKKFGLFMQNKWPEKYWSLARFISFETRDELLLDSSEFIPIQEVGKDSLNEFLKLDQSFVLPNDMLKKVDIIARNFGVVISSPFLDNTIVKFSKRLPEEYKRDKKNGKIILKETYYSHLPEEVFSRSKKGFEVPLFHWINIIFDEVCTKPWWEKEYIEHQALFSFEKVQQLKDTFKNNIQENTTTIWAYIVFQNWYDRWLLK